jgi:hypothetical protein
MSTEADAVRGRVRGDRPKIGVYVSLFLGTAWDEEFLCQAMKFGG